uniref:Axonemal dynein light chain domain containing 1 n=1 Tax=Astyanax mexicanus TaxID=7994 RepID=A0A8B9K6W1_ASTMX
PNSAGVKTPRIAEIFFYLVVDDLIPDELLATLTSTVGTQGRLGPPNLSKTPKHLKVCGARAPDPVWHYSVARKKYQYLLDQPTSVTGAGRDISFLCDALAGQKQRIHLPPMTDRGSIQSHDDSNSIGTLIPEEYHLVKHKGLRGLQCYDEKFTVLLKDDENKFKIFPSMKPSGRLEAVQLMRVMDDMLEKAGVSQEFEELTGLSQMHGLLELVRVEQNIFNIVFHELIRQVSVECAERGQLLAKLRQRYVALLDRIPRQLKGLHTENLAQRALDRRLMEEIICFKHSITQLNEELSKLREHDDHVSSQAEKAQEELAKALEQSRHKSDMVEEYHKLYEMQRKRLEGQVATLTEERDLWSKITYSIALKLKNLQLVSRLHVSEQTWSRTADHFTRFLTTKDSEDLNHIMQLTDQWREHLTSFMKKLKEIERNQCEVIRTIQSGIAKWHKFCEDNIRNPDMKNEKEPEGELCEDLKQWSTELTRLCERYGGEDLLSFQEILNTLTELQAAWVEVFLKLFRRHLGPHREPPQGQATMRELSGAVTEFHKQLGTRVNGESGIHKQLISLGGAMELWTNKLQSLIGRNEVLPATDWLELEMALGSWVRLSEKALLNVDSTQPESEKIKQTPHTKIEVDEVFSTLRDFLSSQNNFFDYENLTLCEEVSSMHVLLIRWMVDLLLQMVPDRRDDQEPPLPTDTELSIFKDVSLQKLEEDAKNLSQKLYYFSKYITGSCQAIVEEEIQKNITHDDKENELFHLSKIQVATLSIFTGPSMISSKHLIPVQDVEEQSKEVTEDNKEGSELKMIGYDGQIIDQTLGEETLQLTGTDDLVVWPHTENAQQAFNALATVGVLQQELLAVEARAVSAEERALMAEEALQAALERIRVLERQYQKPSPEPKGEKKSVTPDTKAATNPEPREVNQKPSPIPKLTAKGSKKR